ncbi:MAG TPA: VCBS repeat-containing protein [Candidatus Sulfotelmatobacter sp.]|nr:VCBS repeat-containing protein [Candidatus Sulfotelmatobacter sp.]
MPAFGYGSAFLRSKSALAAFALIFTSSLTLAQESFMMHYSPSALDGFLVSPGDFNNDGIPDIIVGNNAGTAGAYGISVLLGKGDGRFQSPLNAAKGIGTFDMAVGDFNGDGKLDVAVAGYVGTEQDTVQILLGKGDGTFTKGQTIVLPFNTPASSITTADFDGDGKLDLALASQQLVIYKGAGNGTFTQAASIKVVTGTEVLAQIRVGDFNGDGKPDLYASDGQNLYALFNLGNFTFSKTKLASAPDGIFATPVDVNQDGRTDLIVTYWSCSGIKNVGCETWEVLLGQANKTFTKTASVYLGNYTSFGSPTAADINGDGINDIVGLGQYALTVYLGNPDGTYPSTPLEFPNAGLNSLVAADFNRDGKIDFAGASAGNGPSQVVDVFLNATPRAACTPSTVSPSVTVCEPQDLTYLNSPAKWIADSRDTNHPVTAMQVYVDNKLVVNSPSSSLNESLSFSKGPHFVVTKAWDKSGANFRSDRRITIYSGTPGETCPAAPNSIAVCSPTQNEVTSTFLHVFANAYSTTNQITAMQVYIDGKLIYNDTSEATYVDTALTVAKGPHSVVVKAWDASGNSYSQARNVTAQ